MEEHSSVTRYTEADIERITQQKPKQKPLPRPASVQQGVQPSMFSEFQSTNVEYDEGYKSGRFWTFVSLGIFYGLITYLGVYRLASAEDNEHMRGRGMLRGSLDGITALVILYIVLLIASVFLRFYLFRDR